MFSFTQSKKIDNGDKCNDLAYFYAALVNFSLAHTELMAYQSMIKVQEVAKQASDLAASSEQMSATTQEVTSSTEMIAEKMERLKKDSATNLEYIDNTMRLGDEVKNILQSMVDNANELNNQIKSIDDISENVSDIADQTNMLSLNAAIEAARAGEAGRGFSVVADEVRKLSGQTKDAVKEVKEISDQINQKAVTTNQAVGDVQNNFEKYMESSKSVADSIKKGTEEIEQSAEMIENINGAMKQQTSVAESLAQVATDLASASDFGEVIKEEADELKEIVLPHVKIEECNTIINVLALRLIDHADFLRNIVKTAGSGEPVATHTECAFGKWYHKNMEKYGHIKEFVEIDKPHRAVHHAAQKLSREVNVINLEEMTKSSLDILKVFIKLMNVFKEKNTAVNYSS